MSHSTDAATKDEACNTHSHLKPKKKGDDELLDIFKKHILKQAGLDVNLLMGGILLNNPQQAKWEAKCGCVSKQQSTVDP